MHSGHRIHHQSYVSNYVFAVDDQTIKRCEHVSIASLKWIPRHHDRWRRPRNNCSVHGAKQPNCVNKNQDMAVEASEIGSSSSIGSYAIVIILFVSLFTSYLVSASFVIWRTEGIWRLPIHCGPTVVKNFCQCFSSISFSDYLSRRYYTRVGEVEDSTHDDKPVALRNKLGSKESIIVDSIIDVVPSTIQHISPHRGSRGDKRQPTLPIFIQHESEIDQDLERGYQGKNDSDSSSSSHETIDRTRSQSPLHPFNIDSPDTSSSHARNIHVPVPRSNNNNNNTHFLSSYKISENGLWRLNQGLKAARELINPRSFWTSSTTKTSLLARTWEEAPSIPEPRSYSTFVSTSVS